jgi:hypothetical protein
MERSFRMHELQPILELIKPTLHSMGIEPNKGTFEIKDIVQMTDTIGLAMSPSQAIEALYYAKGDVEKFKYPFTDVELKLFIKWFSDHKSVLRLKTQNYMTKRKQHNHSSTLRPSIGIKKTIFNEGIKSPTNRNIYGGNNPLTPRNIDHKLVSKPQSEDIHFRSKLQVRSFNKLV